MIEAFHSNWTAPFLKENNYNKYYIEDFEILTTILSALKWREKNGKIKMITDEVGAEFYRKIRIDSIWDLGVEVSLDNIPKSINPSIFWAAGKIYSLKEVSEPCAMIDTDFIVWECIENLICKSEVSVIHREIISPDVYPDKEYFNLKDSYTSDPLWNWRVLPCNTALAFLNNKNFKNYYVECAIDFMNNLIDNNNKITNMVFAEQRLIAMCADKMGIKINNIMDLNTLSKERQIYFTHLWGYKNYLKSNWEERKNFCIKCIKRIIKDFPEYEGMVANINELNKYYKLYLEKIR